MGMSVAPAPAGTAPATPATPAGTGTAPAAAPAAPAIPAIQAAADAARDLIAKQAADAAAAGGAPASPAAPTAPAPGEAPVIPADETEEERVAREALEQGGEHVPSGDEGDDKPNPLLVVIDGAREGETFPIEVSDVETADRLRQLQRAALRGDQARAMREEAAALRDEAEEFNYVVEMDPAGVIAEAITRPADQVHLLQYLLTRPGVLAQAEAWLVDLLNDPDKVLPVQTRIVESDRISRRDAVSGEVQAKRALNQNARQLVQAATRSVESLAPEVWTPEMRQQLYKDVLADLRETNRQEVAEAERRGIAHDGRMDPRRVAGMVQRRLSRIGVAPRSAKPGSGTPAAAGTTPAALPGVTPETLKAARAAKAAAASAPPGAGSPSATIPKAPPYDPSKPGSAIHQAADHLRRFVSGLRKPT